MSYEYQIITRSQTKWMVERFKNDTHTLKTMFLKEWYKDNIPDIDWAKVIFYLDILKRLEHPIASIYSVSKIK